MEHHTQSAKRPQHNVFKSRFLIAIIMILTEKERRLNKEMFYIGCHAITYQAQDLNVTIIIND